MVAEQQGGHAVGLWGKKVAAVAGSDFHTVVVCTTGEVLATGRGVEGQLGVPGVETYCVPCVVHALSERDVKAVDAACGRAHTLVLDDRGAVWACGDPARGALGLGADVVAAGRPVHAPVRVPGLKKVVQISCAVDAVAARTAAGELYTWGNGERNALGHGAQADLDTPARVQSIARLHVVDVAMAADSCTTIAVADRRDKESPRERRRRLCPDPRAAPEECAGAEELAAAASPPPPPPPPLPLAAASAPLEAAGCAGAAAVSPLPTPAPGAAAAAPTGPAQRSQSPPGRGQGAPTKLLALPALSPTKFPPAGAPGAGRRLPLAPAEAAVVGRPDPRTRDARRAPAERARAGSAAPPRASPKGAHGTPFAYPEEARALPRARTATPADAAALIEELFGERRRRAASADVTEKRNGSSADVTEKRNGSSAEGAAPGAWSEGGAEDAGRPPVRFAGAV
jgi:hypothetical protein